MTDRTQEAGAPDGRREWKKRQAREILFSCLCSFVLLLFCTRSSPLYPFNNWDDVNSYFSMGKGMMNGVVPYRDLFDQKGILLYFLYGLGYLVSHTSFIGVFLLEVIAASLHLWAVLKLFVLLGAGEMLSFLFLPLYGAAVYSARCVWFGGSAEELMLPLFAWGLWLLFQVLRAEGIRTGGAKGRLTCHLLLAGLLAGCVLHIKFNSLGFFFGWMAAVFFLRLSKDGFAACVMHGLTFLGGMGLATLPWLCYFLINRAVAEWFRVTIWLNLTVYSEKLPLAERFYRMAKTVYFHCLDNPCVLIPALLGMLWFLLSRRFSAGEKTAVAATGIFLTLGIFIGGVTLPYYPLPLTVYALFFVPAAVSILSRIQSLLRIPAPQGKGRILAALCTAAVVLLASGGAVHTFSLNPSFLGTSRSELWQYRFRDDILASGIEHPTLLNMNCFDAGLYCVADIVPNCYFFQTQTIHLDVYGAQKENLKNGDVDFVLACDYYPDTIERRYRVIDQASFDHFGTERVFYLFQKVS